MSLLLAAAALCLPPPPGAPEPKPPSEAEKARVPYRFADLEGMSWSERPAPKARPRPRR